MHELLDAWDGEFVASRRDHETGAMMHIAVHRSRPECAVGGTRIKPYGDPAAALRDALRLSEGMTLKLAALDLPRGGGKAVIDVPGPLSPEARAGLLSRYALLVDSLRGAFSTGPDLGTTPADMDRIREHTPLVFGTSPERGGAGDPGPHTAAGVLAGIRAAVTHTGGGADLRGCRVLVQGLGGVGAPLAALLDGAGAHVLFTDADPVTRCRGEEAGYRWVEPDQAIATECDVFAPCAVGGVVNERSIPRLRCRIVAGSANNVLGSPDDAARLRERGILYAPDFVINGGGAIFLLGIEGLGWSRERVEARVLGIGDTLRQVFDDAERENAATLDAAMRLARRRLGTTVRVGKI